MTRAAAEKRQPGDSALEIVYRKVDDLKPDPRKEVADARRQQAAA